MRGSGGAELEDAFIGRVVGLAVLDGANARLRGDRRRREIGLAGAQVDDVLPRSPAALGFGRNRDCR